MKKSKVVIKLYILYTLNILIAVLPIVLTIAFNFKSYVSTPERAISLTLSGILALTVIVLNAINKLPKELSGVVKLGIITAFLWVLKPLISELCLLCTMLLVGNITSQIIFSHPIKHQKALVEGLERKDVEREIIELEGRV